MKHKTAPVGRDLAYCTVCGGGEGTLTVHCPGKPLTHKQTVEVFSGQMDYHHGQWRDVMRNPFLSTGVRYYWTTYLGYVTLPREPEFEEAPRKVKAFTLAPTVKFADWLINKVPRGR